MCPDLFSHFDFFCVFLFVPVRACAEVMWSTTVPHLGTKVTKKVTIVPLLKLKRRQQKTFTVWKKTYTACENMVNPAKLFPAEVWTHIFSYLSAAEKSSIRASCTYLRKVIDHPSLWRDWSVVLDFSSVSYDTFFWETLRRRKVTSVVVRNYRPQHINVVASSLPAVTILVMDGFTGGALRYLKDFKNVNSLAIRNVHAVSIQRVTTEFLSQQLTHVSLCNILLTDLSALCHLKNLTSFVYHEMNWKVTNTKMKPILAALPKLEHLSLYPTIQWTSGLEECKPQTCQLTSLEILGSGSLLPTSKMKWLSQLKRFAVVYEDVPPKTLGTEFVSKWLSQLPDLSTLVVVRGPPIETYVSSIPVTLTDLTLRDSRFSLEDMAAVAARMPNLQRLQLDTWPSHLGAKASQIPKLFPNLKSLKIRHEHIPEKNFLDLHQMRKLEKLEIVDSHPELPALVRKLRILTNDRFRVLIPPYQRDVLSCSCVW